MGRHPEPLRPRVLSRLIIQPDTGCLLWTASRHSLGYGVIGSLGRMYYVHRLMYQWFTGPIPAGLELDHVCHVRHCGAPAHLEAVTHAENIRRKTRFITGCPQGHPYDEANTYHWRGTRVCKQCKRDRRLAAKASA